MLNARPSRLRSSICFQAAERSGMSSGVWRRYKSTYVVCSCECEGRGQLVPTSAGPIRKPHLLQALLELLSHIPSTKVQRSLGRHPDLSAPSPTGHPRRQRLPDGCLVLVRRSRIDVSESSPECCRKRSAFSAAAHGRSCTHPSRPARTRTVRRTLSQCRSREPGCGASRSGCELGWA